MQNFMRAVAAAQANKGKTPNKCKGELSDPLTGPPVKAGTAPAAADWPGRTCETAPGRWAGELAGLSWVSVPPDRQPRI